MFSTESVILSYPFGSKTVGKASGRRGGVPAVRLRCAEGCRMSKTDFLYG